MKVVDYNINIIMKAIFVVALVSAASALKIQENHGYFWESCSSDADCPPGKSCTGYGSASMASLPGVGSSLFGSPKLYHCR